MISGGTALRCSRVEFLLYFKYKVGLHPHTPNMDHVNSECSSYLTMAGGSVSAALVHAAAYHSKRLASSKTKTCIVASLLPNNQTPNNRVECGTCLEVQQRRVFSEHMLSPCDHGGRWFCHVLANRVTCRRQDGGFDDQHQIYCFSTVTCPGMSRITFLKRVFADAIRPFQESLCAERLGDGNSRGTTSRGATGC